MRPHATPARAAVTAPPRSPAKRRWWTCDNRTRSPQRAGRRSDRCVHRGCVGSRGAAGEDRQKTEAVTEIVRNRRRPIAGSITRFVRASERERFVVDVALGHACLAQGPLGASCERVAVALLMLRARMPKHWFRSQRAGSRVAPRPGCRVCPSSTSAREAASSQRATSVQRSGGQYPCYGGQPECDEAEDEHDLDRVCRGQGCTDDHGGQGGFGGAEPGGHGHCRSGCGTEHECHDERSETGRRAWSRHHRGRRYEREREHECGGRRGRGRGAYPGSGSS